jgi:hypothetical protein
MLPGLEAGSPLDEIGKREQVRPLVETFAGDRPRARHVKEADKCEGGSG